MASQSRPKIRIIGIPTEAETHFAGQSKAPEVLIVGAELGDNLKNAGYNVSVESNIFTRTNSSSSARTRNDVTTTALWQSSIKTNGVRNEYLASAIMVEIYERFFALYNQDNGSFDIRNEFPLVIGGDCSITPALLKALSLLYAPTPTYPDMAPTRLGIIYFDGDTDLNLPSQTGAEGSSGMLDSMVMSMLTQRDGVLPWMKMVAHDRDDRALVDSQNIVLFGFDPLQPSPEHWTYLLENGFKAFKRPSVQQDPVGCARLALEWLNKKVDRVILHFDVDVIDSGEFPLANYPHYAGLGLEQAMNAMRVFLGDEAVVGAIVTEVNPNNDPSGVMVERLVQGLTKGFKARNGV
ncbi:Arginase/deacetylase [Lophiostoma macrostomum CBS 122681]|uniref:Arginase/deacetylase n=1 Tax=Lophiostoma macrostomum CBS 122681 TaxID=1314788 RepID=A0A6A6SNC6_9PLEO|nr:Arginase/deacetylase [Lophiostoma macrostomum CBS 122681]